MYVDVYPLERLPRTLGPFTYSIPHEIDQAIQRGMWVRIPFRKRTIDGIVWNKRAERPPHVARILPIEGVLKDVAPLTNEQLLLAEWMSRQYFLSPALTLHVMVPQRPKRGVVSLSEPARWNIELPITPQRRDAILAFAETLVRGKPTAQFVAVETLAERVMLLLAIRQSQALGQMVVVAPTHVEALRLWSALHSRLADRMVLLAGDLSMTGLWQMWQSVRTKKDALILTTKRGLFAPFTDVRAFLLDLEGDPNHKQLDQNPRYHSRDVLGTLASLHRAPFISMGPVPTLALTTWAALKPPPRLPERPQTRRVVQTKLWDILSEEAAELVRSSRGSVLFFLNRRGSTRVSVCQDCGWEFRCDRCSVPLIEHRVHEYRCHRCERFFTPPPSCPSCAGQRLVGRGLGIERLVSYLRSTFPDRTVVRVDSDTQVQQIGPGALIAATEKILQLSMLPPIDAIVIVRLDDELQFPDFRVLERAYLLFEQLFALARTGSTVLLQTFNADQPIVTALQKRDPDSLYKNELHIRSTLEYPPARRVIRLLGHGSDASALQQEAEKLAETLRREGAATKSFSVTGPWTPIPERKGSDARRFLLVHLLSPESALATLRSQFLHLPTHWLVDVDPESFNA